MSELDDDIAKAKLAALALLSLPGMSYLYYGEEISMVGVKPDENLRTPMQWTREEGAGFTAGLPWRQPQQDYPEKHVAAQTGDPASLLSTYRELIHLHTGTPALAVGELAPLTSDNSAVGAFLRVADDDAALVLINFGKEPAVGVRLDLGPQTLLGPGAYRLEPIYGAPEGAPAPLSVDGSGSLTRYIALPTIPSQTGYIFRLMPADGQ